MTELRGKHVSLTQDNQLVVTQQTLTFLARLHAWAWEAPLVPLLGRPPTAYPEPCAEEKSKALSVRPHRLHPRGSYWEKTRRGETEVQGMVKAWQDFRKDFAEVEPLKTLFAQESIQRLADRILRLTPWVTAEIHGGPQRTTAHSPSRYRTLLHGDFKAMNVHRQGRQCCVLVGAEEAREDQTRLRLKQRKRKKSSGLELTSGGQVEIFQLNRQWKLSIV